MHLIFALLLTFSPPTHECPNLKTGEVTRALGRYIRIERGDCYNYVFVDQKGKRIKRGYYWDGRNGVVMPKHRTGTWEEV